jgi:leucyl aminopeptidase
MISTQALSLTALEKIIIPVGTFTDTTRLIRLFEPMPGFDSMRIFEGFKPDKGAVWRVLHDSGELFLVGLGDQCTASVLYRTMRKFSADHRSLLSKETGLLVDGSLLSGVKSPSKDGKSRVWFAHDTREKTISGMAEAIDFLVNGLFTGTYRLDQRKSDKEHHPLKELVLLYDDAADENAHGTTGETAAATIETWKRAAERGRIIADAQSQAMQLVNIPSNWKTPQQFAKIAADIARRLQIECKILDENRLLHDGFELLLAVNRGSEYPARFVVLDYQGPAAGTAPRDIPHICLVGKGVTFDSGGLSIKPSESMVWMKCDMGGAATVLAATEAIVRLNLPVRLSVVIPLTENLVDARSIKPGDIIGSYSGKTVEIIDTDAEGRLILADALSWTVRNLKPDHIIDLATLTGAAVRTFAQHGSAAFCNASGLANVLLDAAATTGERIWPLPLWSEYNDDIRSDIADVRNFSGKPTAGSISAAKFLEAFIEDHPSWAHLDVAGTVFGDTEFGKQKNATGYGVRLLAEAVEQLASEQ